MINDKNKKIFIYIALVLLVFTLDRLSKIIILNILDNTGRVDIYVNSFLNLYLGRIVLIKYFYNQFHQ